jgi:hypothetical protein
MLRLPLLTTAAIAVLVLLYSGVTFVGAERKLAGLGVELPAHGSYRITLDFAPERYHQLLLQEEGRLVEVQGSTVFMMDVAPSAVRKIARQYWVAAVERWSGH